MSLFVGNISRFVEQKDIEKEFRNYGDCTVDFREKNSKKGKFAFIQFKNDADAEQAKKNLQGRDLQGLKLNIEWSRKSGRFDENKSYMREGKRKGEDRPLDLKPRNKSRSRSHKRRKAYKSRSRSRSKSHKRDRSAPRYENKSRSMSEETAIDCPRDRILKERLKEMKRAKREKRIDQPDSQQPQQQPAEEVPQQ